MTDLVLSLAFLAVRSVNICDDPSLWMVWALVVVAMYPLCRWFAALKQRRSDAWLSYF